MKVLTKSSVKSQDDSLKEPQIENEELNKDELAEETEDEEKDQEHLSEDDDSDEEEESNDSEEEDNTDSDDEEEDSEDSSNEEDDAPTGESSLGQFLKEDKLTLNKRKHTDLQEGDIVEVEGVKEIRSQALYDDLASIVGDNKTEANLNKFFTINNARPKKAQAIAELIGFKNRHQMAAWIEEFKETSPEDRQEVIDSLPKSVKWIADEGLEPPFKIGELKKSEEKTSDSKFPWSPSATDAAINKYVADNQLSKKAVTKSVKFSKKLEEVAQYQREGKPLPVEEAIALAITLSGSKFGKKPDTKTQEKEQTAGGGTKRSNKATRRTKTTRKSGKFKVLANSNL